MHNCPNCGCALTLPEPIVYGNVSATPDGRVVFEGRRLELTRRLHDIVIALISAKGRSLTCSFLAELLAEDVSDEVIVKTVERARRRFRGIQPGFDQIVTVRGFGAYRWAFRPGSSIVQH